MRNGENNKRSQQNQQPIQKLYKTILFYEVALCMCIVVIVIFLQFIAKLGPYAFDE